MNREDGKIILIQLWNKKGKVIANIGDLQKYPPIFEEKINENYSFKNLRNIYRENSDGAVRIIVSKDNPLFQGSKGVARGCSIYLSLIPHFSKIENSHRQHFDAIIKRFAHNLIKFQRRFKDNFARLISEKARSRSHSEFEAEVKRRIEKNTSVAAADVCQMSHRAVDLDAQIDALRIISGYATKPGPDDFIRVDLQKTIYRLTNPFVGELQDRNIVINSTIPSLDGFGQKVVIEPGLMNVIIWQLLDNASKYAKDDSIIEISANLLPKHKELVISMISVCIDQDELSNVCREGQKGRHAGNKAENGIGLFIVKKGLALMGAKMDIKNNGKVCEENNFPYCKQDFVITFASG